MTEISKEKLLETTFYHPRICISCLAYLPWRSKQRELVENIFIKLLKNNPSIIYELNRSSRITFNTWKKVIDTPVWENPKNAFALSSVFETLNTSIQQFLKDGIPLTESDHPYIYKFTKNLQNILDTLEKDSYISNFLTVSNIPDILIALSQFLPDTPLWDSVRTIIQTISLNFQHNWKVTKTIPYKILTFASKNITSVNDKIFRTFMIPEPFAQEIRNKINNPPRDFDLYIEQLKFAIHNETEFLECWKRTSTRMRRILASYYFHISPTLLETFLKKYSQTKLIDILLKHPQIPDAYLIFHASKQNLIAFKLIKERQKQNNQ